MMAVYAGVCSFRPEVVRGTKKKFSSFGFQMPLFTLDRICSRHAPRPYILLPATHEAEIFCPANSRNQSKLTIAYTYVFLQMFILSDSKHLNNYMSASIMFA